MTLQIHRAAKGRGTFSPSKDIQRKNRRLEGLIFSIENQQELNMRMALTEWIKKRSNV